jgi:predicted dehydrogenase
VNDLFSRVQQGDSYHLAACCEEDPETREALKQEGKVQITHESASTMLAEVEFDVLIIGDYYSRRGELAIAGLRSGRHVLSDKPLCTSRKELDEIQRLSAEQDLKVGCMLDQRDKGFAATMRDLVRSGELGDVQSVQFLGNHPLLLGSRPEWYFEEGKHGGTINDIAIHGIDLIRWATGAEYTAVVGARCWNAGYPQLKHFQNGAHLMLAMNTGCTLSADVSYLVPDSFGYAFPLYWRYTIWGTKGVLEAGPQSNTATLYSQGGSTPKEVPVKDDNAGGYLDSFMRDLSGQPKDGDLTTADVLAASRVALAAQVVADNGAVGATIP